MKDILDLERYPLHKPGSAQWLTLIEKCQSDLSKDGMFNLEGFVKVEALTKAVHELKPIIDTLAFVHKRRHNIYFKKEIPGLAADHPALTMTETINHTVCYDQIPNSIPAWIYEWPPFIVFLAAVMEKDSLFPMRDILARINVMAYRDGEQLNWHFDRSEFTTTLLLQAPDQGGDFVYRSNLRSDENPNYDGVAKLLNGEDKLVKTLKLSAGTLNVFRGKNTAHKVSTIKGGRERIIAVFSYFDRPGVVFTKEDQIGFYGRSI
jgi:hypothetical protein